MGETTPSASRSRSTPPAAADGEAGSASRTSAPPAPSGRRRGRWGREADSRAPYGWWPVAVIVAVSLVDRLESSVISAILPLLQAEWGFSDTAGGSLSAAISITGTLVALPAGYLADRVRRTRLLAVVVALWSVITLGSAVAVGFAMFYATRLVLAAADSIDTPSQVSLLADYYSVTVRPKVLGVHRMITFAGAALGTFYGGIVGDLFGWRAVFYAIIVPGLLVAWGCYRLPEPRRGEADRRAALLRSRPADAEATADPPAEPAETGRAGPVDGHGPAGGPEAGMTQPPGWQAFKRQFGVVVRIRTVIRVYAGLAAMFFALQGIFFWLPTFYRREHDLDVATAGMVTAGVTLAGVVTGTWAGGVLGERWHGRITGGRVVAGAGGMILGSVLFTGALVSPTLAGQVAALLASVTALSVAIPTLQAAIADALPANQRGVGFSLLGIFITGGAFGPLLVGAVSDATGSLATAFGILLVPMAVGGAITLLARWSYEADAGHALDEALGDGDGTTRRPDA